MESTLPMLLLVSLTVFAVTMNLAEAKRSSGMWGNLFQKARAKSRPLGADKQFAGSAPSGGSFAYSPLQLALPQLIARAERNQQMEKRADPFADESNVNSDVISEAELEQDHVTPPQRSACDDLPPHICAAIRSWLRASDVVPRRQ